MVTGSPTLAEIKSVTDAAISGFLRGVLDDLPDSRPLIEHIERLLTAGGKRLRPAFCYWGFRAAGGLHGKDIIRAASALELLHTFALVHDDIMDAAEERRGVPTVHTLDGVDVALLVGDLALVLADALLVESGFDPAAVARCLTYYSRMRKEVIVGQYMDLRLAGADEVNEAAARDVARMKSGRYSVREPLLIGAALARTNPVSGLSDFGELLGEAFQLRDDLLGTFGDRATTGKPIDSDIREGKKNVLYAKTLSSLTGDDLLFFESMWGAGDKLSPSDCERVRALVESSGARRETETLLETLKARSRDELARIDLPDDVAAGLEELIESATARDN